MIKQILLLRCHQSVRLLRSTGIRLMIATLLVIIGMALTALSRIVLLPPYAAVIAGAIIIIIVHIRRPDLTFLQGLDGPDYRQVRILLIIEYFIIMSPLICVQILFGQYLIVSALFLLAILFGFNFDLIRWKRKSLCKRSLTFLPLDVFELKFHIERYPLAFVVCIILSFFGCIHIGFLIVALYLSVLFLLDAYTYNEPPEMIHWHDRFVLEKIVKTVRLFFLFFIIQIIIAAAFHSDKLFLLIYFLLVTVVLLSMMISYKYSSYHPLFSQSGSSQVLAIFILLSVLPAGLLITIPYTVIQFIKANKRMKSYYA